MGILFFDCDIGRMSWLSVGKVPPGCRSGTSDLPGEIGLRREAADCARARWPFTWYSHGSGADGSLYRSDRVARPLLVGEALPTSVT